MEKPPFKIIKEKEIKVAYDYQRDTGWTFYNERELTETTFHNRFNFLLLAYSLFISAYFITDEKMDKLIILLIGFTIILILSVGIFRSHTRLTILLNILKSLDANDVIPFYFREYEGKRIARFFSRNFTNGLLIPIFMLFSLIIGIINIFCPFIN